ncbi:MAG: hypothetical protein P9M00_02355 [Candidatus Tritonobacter lacicola]|nr:hypothetical protein [Candidatus Tritonobacter lacicola]
MKRLLILIILCPFLVPYGANAKSITRPGEPRLTFVNFSIDLPQPIEQGAVFRFTATIIPTQNIWEEEQVFLHIVSPDDPERVLINADFTPPYSTTRWAVGEAVKLGPINLKAPREFKPGKYKIQLGLFHRRDDGVYVREKYTNADIKNWLVGDIEFKAPPRTGVKLPDLVISDFSSAADLAKWQARGVDLSRRNNTCVVEYISDEANPIPSVILQDFFNYSDPKYSDWREYDRLSYEIGLDPEYNVMLQIKDKGGNRYQVRATEEEGKGGKVEVDLVSVGKVIDLQRIGNLSFFTYKPANNFTMTLGDIRIIDTGEVGFTRAFIEFKGLNAPKKARADSTITLTAHFLLHQKFPRDETMFIHFYRISDRSGYFTADKRPLKETSRWATGKVVSEGPLKIYIPPDSPPGIYNIDLGFFSTQRTGADPVYVKAFTDSEGVIHEVQPTKAGTDYVRQPYTNPSAAGPWTVGEIEILPAEE